MDRPDSAPRLLLYNAHEGGHHAGYAVHIVRAWRDLGVRGRLVAALAESQFEDLPGLRDLEGPTAAGSVEFAQLKPTAQTHGPSEARRVLGQRRLLRELLEAYRPPDTLALTGDHVQVDLATGLRLSYPARVSLLLLRVAHHRAHPGRASLRDRVVRTRKVALLWAALRSPHAGLFFTADPDAVAALNRLSPTGHQGTFLPDPVPLPTCTEPPEAVRARYEIEPGRTVFLFFGALAARKGVYQTLAALRALPPDVAARTAVLFAGAVQPDIDGAFQRQIAEVRAATQAQIVLDGAYLREPEICACHRAADVCLLPYIGHPGTSSVLIRAAGARKPVIGQDGGLMREQVRDHRLGQVVDTADPAAIARAMAGAVAGVPSGFDAGEARAFAESQTPDVYAGTLLRALGLLDPPGPGA